MALRSPLRGGAAEENRLGAGAVVLQDGAAEENGLGTGILP